MAICESHTPLILYWEGVRKALKNHTPLHRRALKHGFSPKSCLVASDKNMFMDNVEVCKGVAQNEPYNGPACDCPQPSFRTRVHYHEVFLCIFNQSGTHGCPHWKMTTKTFIVNMH